MPDIGGQDDLRVVCVWVGRAVSRATHVGVGDVRGYAVCSGALSAAVRFHGRGQARGRLWRQGVQGADGRTTGGAWAFPADCQTIAVSDRGAGCGLAETYIIKH